MQSDHTTYLLDVGVLIALTNSSHALHERAHRWFATIQSWGTTPLTEAGYLRLMLSPRVVGGALRRADVLAALVAIRRLPGYVFIPDASSLAKPVIDLVGLMSQRQVASAHLVNLAAQRGAVLATLDATIEQMLVPTDRQWVRVI